MELNVLNIKGEATGNSVVLNEEIFAIEPNDHAIYLDVKQYLANQRQGTHKSKERGDIVGSTRKIKKQKGTGTARAGSIKSPIFRGGGRVFGPQPRNYGFKLNRKLKALARKSALSYKAKSEDIMILDALNFDAPKTKDIVALGKSLKVSDKKLLIVLATENKNVYLSSRNLKNVSVVTASELNTYSIMRSNKVIFVENSVSVVEDLFKA